MTEPTNEALADNLDNLVAYCDGRGGEHACMGLDDRDNVALAATRLRSQPAPASEEAAELQQLRDEVAEWKERHNRKDGEYGRAIEAAYCCVRCGKPTPLAQARKEALEEAAGIVADMALKRDKEADAEHDGVKKMQGASLAVAANALRSRAGEIGP